MKKVLLFSLFLVVGLWASQIMPNLLGENYEFFKESSTMLLYVCLSFIMINVGREFEVDKSRWKSYAVDYFIAMATAAMPWILIALYYVFVLLPSDLWSSGAAWKENLLLSRFAAPTSAGILFTMLAAINLQKSWIYKKIQVLAIFDDLDTILLMIPLLIMMIGFKWQMFIVIAIVTLLLYLGWRYLNSCNMPQKWYHILIYSILVCAFTHIIYVFSNHEVHIEVLLPAFVLGMIIKPQHYCSCGEERASTTISFVFMFLVGLSMPQFVGVESSNLTSITGAQPMMSWDKIAFHVIVVSALSNLGKMFPMLFYRDRSWRERMALSVGMFTRGEVGAGVVFIALSYNLGGPALIISVLTLALNLILTGFFVMIVKKLALRVERGVR